MAIGFFDGDRANASPESVRRKREMAARLLQRRTPRNVGEGLDALGKGLLAAVMGSRADSMEREGNADAARVQAGFFGGPVPAMASAGNPVATGSATGSAAVSGNVGRGPAAFQEIGPRIKADLMRDFQLAPEQAAGIVGNLAHESGGFGTLQEIKPMIPGSRGGFGYAQWTGPRRRQFESWAAENRLDPSSYEANYGFLKHELANTSEGRVLDRIRQTNDPTQATRIFSDVFLRPGIPGMGSREKWTQRALGFSQQPQSASNMPVVQPGPGAAQVPLADMPAPNAAPAEMVSPLQAMPMVAENEQDTQFLENAMAAQQSQPMPVEPMPVNQGDVFSPVPMGGGYNPFVPREAMQADAPAPASQEAQMVMAPIPPQRPVDLAPQSPFVPPEMRQAMQAQAMPIEQTENGAGVAQFAAQNAVPMSPQAQSWNPFVQQPAQAPQMAASGVPAQMPMTVAPMAGEAPQAPASRMQQLASLISSPMVRPEIKQLAMQQFQQEQAQSQAMQERAMAEAQNRRIAQDLGIPESLAGVAPVVTARAQQMFPKQVNGQPKRSLQPVFGTDAQGNTVMLQPGEDGTAVQTKMPEGVRIASGVDRIDAGTKFILIDKRTGQVVGEQAKDIAGAAREGVIGKDQGERVVNAPGEIRVADEALATIKQIREHPGRDAWGAQGTTASLPWINRGIPGTQGRDFVALVEQAQGQAFLQAFESLKGGGQITQVEGEQATKARARLDRTQSREGFDTALKDIEAIANKARDRAMRGVRVTPDGREYPVGQPPPPPLKAAPAQTGGPRIISVEPVR